MKISMLVGISALACAAVCGCSGASSSPTVGSGNAPGTGDIGGGTASGSSVGFSGGGTGSSGAAAPTGASGASTAGSPGVAASGDPSGSVVATGSADGGPAAESDDGGAAPKGIMTSTTAPTDNDETDYTGTKTLTMDTFNVPANTEVFYCQTFANPWGKQVDIKTYALEMDQGSHHMFAFYKSSATDGAAAPCASGGLTFGSFTFTSQTPQLIETFPATVGATIPQGDGFNMMVHYLNTTTSSLTAHVSLTMYVAKPNVVTNHAGVIFMNNITMTVPATGQPVVSTASLKVDQAVSIMATTSHMHKFATNFVYTATPPSGTAQQIYTTTQWDEPKPQVFTTPLQFPSGTNYTWSCTDVNNTGKALTFGEYAQTNVMCIAVAIFYPVQNVDNPVLGSVVGGF
jgi:hypothetical protein